MAEAGIIGGLGEIAGRYDGFLVDLWGCVHDGVRPFPEALEALGRIRPKAVCLLSNGPRRTTSLVRRLDEMGVPRDLYDAVMSSGESAWEALARRDDDWHARLGRRCRHMGPERDADVREGNGLIPAATVGEADFILCTGIAAPGETVADYEAALAAGAGRGLPMVCANPDLLVHVGTRPEICAGALAARYAELGGDVAYHGKPWPRVYGRALAMLGDPDPARVLAIGDGLRTDVAGANAAGMDSLFLAGGIHAGEVGLPPDPGRLDRLSRELGVGATWAMSHLAW